MSRIRDIAKFLNHIQVLDQVPELSKFSELPILYLEIVVQKPYDKSSKCSS